MGAGDAFGYRENKMTTGDFMKSLANLLLVADEGTKDWVNVPALRRLWYAFCALMLALVGMSLGVMLIKEVLNQSEATVLSVRVILLCIFASLIGVLIKLTISYFKFVLGRRAAITLENVGFFYITSVLLFGMLYLELWLLAPTTFSFPSPPVEHSPKLVGGIGFLRLKIDFILFSALRTVGSTSYAIQTNSVVSALISWLQGIYTLSLIALLIASYVNQKMAPLPDNTGYKAEQDAPRAKINPRPWNWEKSHEIG